MHKHSICTLGLALALATTHASLADAASRLKASGPSRSPMSRRTSWLADDRMDTMSGAALCGPDRPR